MLSNGSTCNRYNAAQYELGEMFRRGLFTDSVELFLARKYLTLAAAQGHAEAVARLEEMDRDRLRLEEMRRDGLRCVFCGADDVPNACSYCPSARYCNMECSIAHWRRGGASPPRSGRRRRRTGRRAPGRSRAALDALRARERNEGETQE
jgi:TPR repeat protein